MSSGAGSDKRWSSARDYLVQNIRGWLDPDDPETLTLPLPDEDWLLEVTAEGKLICMAGYDLEDMRSILGDGTTEDLGSDELAKQAKFYLQQTVSKYRRHLLAHGFSERMEMNDSHVAAHFERDIDLSKASDVLTDIQTCRKWFAPASSSN